MTRGTKTAADFKQEIIRPYPSAMSAVGSYMKNVLCSDGKLRTAVFTAEPDTFFTQPSRVKVKGVTVTGHIYFDSSYNDYEGIWKFSAYSYRKNAHMLPEWSKDA